jgi:hypothetical protein
MPPRPSWVGFAEVWAAHDLCEAEQRFLLLFWKKKKVIAIDGALPE